MVLKRTRLRGTAYLTSGVFGLAAGAGYWLLETALHVIIEGQSIQVALCTHGDHELRMRLIPSILIMASAFAIDVLTRGSRRLLEEVQSQRAALQASEERFRSFAESAHDAILSLDGRGEILYCNRAGETIFGYPSGGLAGKLFLDLLPEELRPSYMMRLRRLASDGDGEPPARPIETEAVRADGRVICAEVSLASWQMEGGRFFGVILRDVSERRQSEARARKLASAIEHAWDPIVITDQDAVIHYVNPAYTRVTGSNREDVLSGGQSILSQIAQEPAAYEMLHRTILEGRPWAGRFEHRRKDGTPLVMDASISPINDDGAGGRVGFVVVERDVTEELALREAAMRIRHYELFSRIVAGVAHEVRNPMQSILSASTVLKEGTANLGPERRQLLELIPAQLERVSALISDLADIVSPIDEKGMRPVNLDDVLKAVVADWIGEGETAPSAVRTTPSPCEIRVRMDVPRLKRALLELLRNAAQHSPDGSEIGLFTRLDNGQAVIYIRDRGTGIPPEYMDKVLDPFFTLRAGGTGLGLSFVHHVLEHHKGSLRLTNNLPRPGCTAEVRLPVEGWPGSTTSSAAPEGAGN